MVRNVAQWPDRRSLLQGGLALAAAAPGMRAVAAQSEGGVAFPLRASTAGRFLEDSAGTPFFLHGDSAWSLIAQLTLEDAEHYLRDRRQRGFNTLLVSLLEHRFATRAPANAYGEGPFTRRGDYSTPNEAYFAHADRVLQRAAALGFLMLLTPSYMGAAGGEEGWYKEMAANGAAKLQAYGEFIGRRYARFSNILWVHGGDYDPPDKSLARAVVNGIRQHDTRALHTAHGGTDSAVAEAWADEPWLDLSNLYTYGPVIDAAQAELRRDHRRPFFLIESVYENEHGAGEHRLRTQAYQALLSGACGHIFGNNPIWHFSTPGPRNVPIGWREALGGRGSVSMQHLLQLVRSRRWWLLEPEPAARLLQGNAGTGHDRMAAARAADGSFAWAYLPSGRAATIDLGQLRGPHVAAAWYDVANGRFQPAAEANLAARGKRAFAPPQRNSAGLPDWVLELRSDG